MRRVLLCLVGLGIAVGATHAARLLWSQQTNGRRQPPERRQPGPDGPPRGVFEPEFGPPPDRMFEAIDSNRDGQISPQEIRNAAAALKKLDANGDGELSGEEVFPPIPGGAGMFLNRGGGPGGPRGPLRQERKLVKQFDKDNNQRLDLEERGAAR
ncbi:MAG: EF-hand domain-containing protein, partial [Planctomycetaceae bacterium]